MDTFSRAVMVTYAGLTFYCFNENRIDIEDFIELETNAFYHVFKKHYMLFGKCTTNTMRGDGTSYEHDWMVSAN